jgi:hypothetical protein
MYLAISDGEFQSGSGSQASEMILNPILGKTMKDEDGFLMLLYINVMSLRPLCRTSKPSSSLFLSRQGNKSKKVVEQRAQKFGW